MRTPLIMFFIVCLISGCVRQPNAHDDRAEKTIQILPSGGVIGTKVKLVKLPQNSLSDHPPLTFTGVNDFIRADSVAGDTIYTIVPFGAQNGDVIIQTTEDRLIAKNFSVSEDSPDRVRVCASDLNYTIDQRMSLFTQMTVISEYKWTAETSGDTVRLSAGFHPGDFSVYYHLSLLNTGADQLPVFIEGFGLYESDYGESRKYPLDKGVIKIQDWNIDSLISGRVFSTPWNNNNYTFWYKF